jgi:hypothetical protein
MAWIFQGNPNRFDIDDYLCRYSFIYWSTPTNQKEISIGDEAFIWRSGSQAGIIAIGNIKELPTLRKYLNKPEALGDDLWVSQLDEPTDIKVGIEIEESRLTPDEGMIQRESLKTHPILCKNRIITNPVGTVFRLNLEETNLLLGLWNIDFIDNVNTDFSAFEGNTQLKAHYRRERSRKLVTLKKEQYKQVHGILRCELCGLSFEEIYPKSFGENYIEAHHKTPLAEINQLIRTTMGDLILVCANCHRMIHRSKDVENNLSLLLAHFGKQ